MLPAEDGEERLGLALRPPDLVLGGLRTSGKGEPVDGVKSSLGKTEVPFTTGWYLL